MEDEKIIIRIDKETKKEFDMLCKNTGRKMSTLIKLWIKEFIKKEEILK